MRVRFSCVLFLLFLSLEGSLGSGRGLGSGGHVKPHAKTDHSGEREHERPPTRRNSQRDDFLEKVVHDKKALWRSESSPALAIGAMLGKAIAPTFCTSAGFEDKKGSRDRPVSRCWNLGVRFRQYLRRGLRALEVKDNRFFKIFGPLAFPIVIYMLVVMAISAIITVLVAADWGVRSVVYSHGNNQAYIANDWLNMIATWSALILFLIPILYSGLKNTENNCDFTSDYQVDNTPKEKAIDFIFEEKGEQRIAELIKDMDGAEFLDGNVLRPGKPLTFMEWFQGTQLSPDGHPNRRARHDPLKLLVTFFHPGTVRTMKKVDPEQPPKEGEETKPNEIVDEVGMAADDRSSLQTVFERSDSEQKTFAMQRLDLLARIYAYRRAQWYEKEGKEDDDLKVERSALPSYKTLDVVKMRVMLKNPNLRWKEWDEFARSGLQHMGDELKTDKSPEGFCTSYINFKRETREKAEDADDPVEGVFGSGSDWAGFLITVTLLIPAIYDFQAKGIQCQPLNLDGKVDQSIPAYNKNGLTGTLYPHLYNTEAWRAMQDHSFLQCKPGYTSYNGVTQCTKDGAKWLYWDHLMLDYTYDDGHAWETPACCIATPVAAQLSDFSVQQEGTATTLKWKTDSGFHSACSHSQHLFSIQCDASAVSTPWEKELYCNSVCHTRSSSRDTAKCQHVPYTRLTNMAPTWNTGYPTAMDSLMNTTANELIGSFALPQPADALYSLMFSGSAGEVYGPWLSQAQTVEPAVVAQLSS